MAKIGLPKGSGKRLKVREKSVKSQGILKWILSGNPGVNKYFKYISLLSSFNGAQSCSHVAILKPLLKRLFCLLLTRYPW